MHLTLEKGLPIAPTDVDIIPSQHETLLVSSATILTSLPQPPNTLLFKCKTHKGKQPPVIAGEVFILSVFARGSRCPTWAKPGIRKQLKTNNTIFGKGYTICCTHARTHALLGTPILDTPCTSLRGCNLDPPKNTHTLTRFGQPTCSKEAC